MKVGLIIFLIILPALAALGFDGYLYYQDQEEGFKLTHIGWAWVTYHEGSHNAAVELIGKDSWEQYIIPVLSLPLVAAVAILGSIIFFIIIMLKGLSSIGSGKVSSGRSKKSLGRDRGSGKEFKYKR